jgi:hypothetical protein
VGWKVTRGATRNVLLTSRYAIKIPRVFPWSWILFRLGFQCNRLERRYGCLGHQKLCPVLFADRWGILVIMPRCEPAKPLEPYRDLSSRAMCQVEWDYWNSQGLPFDNYYFNFGYYEGRLVALDYGTDYRVE